MSSSCQCDATPSSGGGIGSTLTGGIQDIAGILPLLGTEQCSDQVSSALTRGYLYAAASPMSIFGSLGLVMAGFQTLLACFSFEGIDGAKILRNIGFEPKGENLSLIMLEAGEGKAGEGKADEGKADEGKAGKGKAGKGKAGKGEAGKGEAGKGEAGNGEAGKGKKTGRYIIETRMDELIKKLNIDEKRITGVSRRSVAWNVKMMAATALLCTFSIAPYIYLNLGANNLNKSTTWVFPVLRSTGGFITATFIQLLIQRRIITLSNQYLDKRGQQPNVDHTDIEAAVELGDTKKHQMDVRTWLMLSLLLIGLVASVVGYVGCFSVVQNSTSKFGPVSWLCLEVGLSVMRLVIWAWNPEMDDAPPLEITLKLDRFEHKPLPTCNKDNEEILRYKVLPLTRARDFLKIMTSFAGLIEPFSNLDLSLYYTLTRKRLPADAEKRKLGEWILYITVFDHKERTTRVYTRDNENKTDTFYSTKSDAPRVDVGHFLLEVEIDAIIQVDGDPASDSNILKSLQKHHQSILEHIQHRLGAGNDNPYTIENKWTMKAEDTISTLKRLREKDENEWERVVKIGKEARKEERNEELICDYFTHSSNERERRWLDEKRVEWIARRMKMITEETKEEFQGKMGVYRLNEKVVENPPATKTPEDIEQLLCRERCMMELLLLYEAKEWEQLFWKKFQAFLLKIGNHNDRVELKQRLTREWRADCWKRLNAQMHAAEKRLADLDIMTRIDEDWFQNKEWFLETLINHWASISKLFEPEGDPNSTFLFELRETILRVPPREIRKKEIEDIEFRLELGSKSGRFNQFWDDDTLFKCRYSRSKWLYLRQNLPLEIYSHALKRNKNIIHITFSELDSDSDVNRFQDTICDDLTWVTSISRDFGHLPAIRRDPLFIRSTTGNNDLETFAKDIRSELNRFSTYIFTDTEGSDMYYYYSDRLGINAKVLISFVAPSSGQSLILRLEHSGEEDGPLEVTLGSTKIQLNPSSKSPLTIDDITLGPSESDHLSFEPGRRNDIFIQFKGTVERHGHFLHDIELLDETGCCWSGGSEESGIINVD